MKSKDISLIVVIALFSAILSFFVSNSIISSGEKNATAEVAVPISSEFQRPPQQYFNANSINPTQEIRIQQDEDSNPFGPN